MYILFLQETLPVLLEEIPLAIRHATWYQQYAAHLISDNMCDRSLMLCIQGDGLASHVKAHVYRTPLATVQNLIGRIVTAIGDVKDSPRKLVAARQSVREVECHGTGSRAKLKVCEGVLLRASNRVAGVFSRGQLVAGNRPEESELDQHVLEWRIGLKIEGNSVEGYLKNGSGTLTLRAGVWAMIRQKGNDLEPMRVKRAAPERKGGGNGNERKNPPTSGIVRHNIHMRKSGATSSGIEPGSYKWEEGRLITEAPGMLYVHFRIIIVMFDKRNDPIVAVTAASDIADLLMAEDDSAYKLQTTRLERFDWPRMRVNTTSVDIGSSCRVCVGIVLLCTGYSRTTANCSSRRENTISRGVSLDYEPWVCGSTSAPLYLNAVASHVQTLCGFVIKHGASPSPQKSLPCDYDETANSRRYGGFNRKRDYVAARPRSRREGAIKTTVTRTASASSLLRARRSVSVCGRFPRKPADQLHRPARFPLAKIRKYLAGIELGSSWWKASSVTTKPQLPLSTPKISYSKRSMGGGARETKGGTHLGVAYLVAAALSYAEVSAEGRHGVVAVSLGYGHPCAASPRAAAPGAPVSPAAVDGRLLLADHHTLLVQAPLRTHSPLHNYCCAKTTRRLPTLNYFSSYATAR
ncbi:hypothetical protein PR048_015845 [Dryococelus australis]|uniref:Uncharacterized protein n=1 Tax=Dryococelus australis TaxID=614101 RepID=A0ABQ9HIE0_9NEOP|nr:hypothetical protein PR048_015845 [Dryococelus australis]